MILGVVVGGLLGWFGWAIYRFGYRDGRFDERYNIEVPVPQLRQALRRYVGRAK